MCDLLVVSPELWSPETGTATGSVGVAIKNGRILCAGSLASLPPAVVTDALRRIELGGSAHRTLLLPGLIDLHCHWDPTGGDLSRYGLDPDTTYLPRCVTTVLSQGDAGADNWPEYSAAVAGCKCRCLMAMNLLRAGESPAYFETHADGEDLVDFDVAACANAVEAAGELCWGVDLNVGHNHGSVAEMAEATRRAVAVAERTSKPILFGMRR